MKQVPAVDLVELRKQGRTPWGRIGSDADAVAVAATASAELARRAYAQGDRDARRQAESMIYFLNIDSYFAPPVDPVAGVVWTTLMQSKLAELRRDFGGDLGSAEFTDAEMQSQLEAAVTRWGAFNHPLLDDLQRSRSLPAYCIWAKNWFGSCFGFSLQLGSLVQRTTGETRRAVIDNLNDEFNDEATHDSLRIRFYESLGLHPSPEEAVADPDWVLDSTELLNLRTGLCNLNDPMPALGCFYGVEANWPAECRRHHAMNTDRGLDARTLEYWSTHAFADEHHSEEWLGAIKSLAQTGAQRAAVVEGAVIQLRLRWRMYDAIRARALRVTT